MRSSRLPRAAVVSALAIGLVAMAGPAFETVFAPDDPLLDGDPIDPATGRAAEIVPGAPWVRWTDGGWRVERRVVGDVDLVVRSGFVDPADGIPAPGSGEVALGTAEPFGRGVPVPLTVLPSDGRRGAGAPVRPPYWEGLPVLVAAFPDLDGDGYVGVTNRDGNRRDFGRERQEWTPVGLAWAFGRDGAARAELRAGIGGPSAAPARVALVAAAYAGPIDPDYRDGVFPRGPAVMTALPFLPVTAPDALLYALPLPAVPPEPGARIAVDVQVAFAPWRESRRLREAFAVALDGSEASVDVAEVRSGRVVRVGLARRAGLRGVGGAVRPGVDARARPLAIEVLSRLALRDDGRASRSVFRLVPLDRLGNVGDPEAPLEVRVNTDGVVRIVAPDRDGDPFSETLVVHAAHGTQLALDDAGRWFDDANEDVVRIETAAGLSRVDVFLADPDVDDDGDVDWRDVLRVFRGIGAELGAGDFEPALDQDGSGRIDSADVRIVAAELWRSLPVP